MSEFIVKVKNETSQSFFIKNTTSDQKINGADAVNLRTQSTLTAHFKTADLKELLELDNSDGIHLYPAISNSKLALLAVATSDLKGDLVEGETPCFVSNGESPALRLSVENAKKMVDEIKTDLESKDFLSPFRASGSKNKYFKAAFKAGTLTPLLKSAESIRFDIARVEFEQSKLNHKTLAVSSVDSQKRISDEVYVSLLPCPPHCSSGYINTN